MSVWWRSLCWQFGQGRRDLQGGGKEDTERDQLTGDRTDRTVMGGFAHFVLSGCLTFLWGWDRGGRGMGGGHTERGRGGEWGEGRRSIFKWDRDGMWELFLNVMIE